MSFTGSNGASILAPLRDVEIGSPATAVAAAVFVLTFFMICVVGLRFVRSGSAGPNGARSRQLNISRQLPISRANLDRIARLATTAALPPNLSPDTRAAVEKLQGTREVLRQAYRGLMIVIGLFGVGASIALFRQADWGNMMALPAGIVLLLSLGALLQGLVPTGVAQSPSWRRNDLMSLLDKVDVNVSTEPITISLAEADLTRAKEMVRQGASAEEVARATYAGYDELHELQKAAVQRALGQVFLSQKG